MSATDTARLRRTGIGLEIVTLTWNVVGVVLLGVLAWQSRSVALLAFGLDSLIEIGASAVVVWELSGSGDARRRFALRLIGWAFVLLAAYLLVQAVVALATGHHSSPVLGGVGWTAATAVVMFALAWGKHRVGTRLGNPVLITEGRVTLIDGVLATAVLAGLLLDLLFGLWWADPLAALVVVFYALREAMHIFRE
ncbi:cation transporter [Leifsonia sp. fls2-241-R2A-40a]|uniref:cation transporter n=1 Tax=Leifsonia sp. fls2-241-R2A-40a TaxID=3040290 RepID=UPI00254AE484|nr:cation transporter [Leifsonia sp. fls2-241-R2A-40a]